MQKIERRRKVRRARSDLTGECIVGWDSSENGEMAVISSKSDCSMLRRLKIRDCN